MRRLLLVLAAALAIVLPARAARAQSIPAGPGSELSSLVGQSLSVPFVVDMTARPELLGSFAMRIAWNPAVLRFDNGLPGSFGGVTVNSDSVMQGVIRLAGANPAGAGGVVTVGVSRFTPLLADTTTLQVAVTELFAAVSFADLLPSATVNSGLYCPARGRYGDVDRDGNANSRDALVDLSNAVGLNVSAFDIILGDVDADGNANARDALIILSAAVGLDVSAYRVLALAGGACTSGPPVVFTVVPGVVGDVAIGQSVQFEARATDGAGMVQAVSAQWLVSDPAVLGVLASGLAVARDTGLADVIAVRDGRDTARMTVHVVARRGTWTVDAAAIGATNRLGSPVLPFATLTEAAAAMRPRDTVVVRPGRYGESVTFSVPVVLLGQRSGGAGVVIAANGGSDGLTLDGSGVSEVHDLAIEGFDVGLRLGNNVDTVIVDSLRVLAFGGSCPTAIRADDAWALIVRHSQLIGDGWNGCASGIELYGNVRLVVVEDTYISDMGGGDTGIYGNNVDSMVIRRSQLSDINDYALRVNAYAYSGGGRVPAASSVALVVDSSRFLRNSYDAIYADNVRSAVITHTVIDTRGSYYADALNIYGVDSAYVRLVGDSILVDDNDWFYGYGFDSVTVDSTRVVGAYYGDLDGVDYVRVTNSSFLQSTGGTLLYTYPNRLPTTTIVIDSVTASGDGSCGRCMDFLDASDARVTVNRLRLDDFSYGIYTYDSSVTVTNSVFTNGYQGVYGYGSYSAPQRMVVQNSAFTDVYYPIESDDYVTVVENTAIVRSSTGIYTSGAGTDTLRFNTVSASYDGIAVWNAPALVTNNVLTGIMDDGIIVVGPAMQVPADSAVVVNNRVSCPANAFAWTGIQVRDLHARVQGNTITGGCEYGILLEPVAPGTTALVRGNSVTLDPNTIHSGIRVDAGWHARVVNNLVTGGRDEGTIRVGGSSDYSRAQWVLVDSNTVQNAVGWGIRAEWLDTVEIRGNLVEDVTSPCCFGPNPGAIATGQVRTLARVAGNTVRRAAGAGIAVEQQEYYYYPRDTATVFVDSNAVSAADTVAVRIGNGIVSLRHNNIRNNARDGVRLDFANGVHVLRDNAFQGNGLYAVNNSVDGSVDADNNWWGVDGQPPRQSGDTVIPGVDSVNTAFDNAPLALEPTGLLPLAPPAFRPVAALAAVMTGSGSVRTAPSGRAPAPAAAASRISRDELVARRVARLQARAAAEAQRVRRPALQAPSAATAVTAVTAARAQRRAAFVRTATARAAERAQRDSVRAERRARPEQAREVRP